MTRLVSDQDREAIVEAVRSGGTRYATAKAFGVSHTFVSKLCRAAGLAAGSGQTAALQLATESRILTNKSRRVDLVEALLEDADVMRRSVFAPELLLQWDGTSGTWVERLLERPNAKDQRDRAIAMAILIDKSIALERHDYESSTASRGAIVDLMVRLAEDEESEAAAGA